MLAVRLLAFSDLHRDRRRARSLARRASDADVVVGAGDFASFHLGLRRTIDILGAIETPSVLVPGNNETDAALRRACASWSRATVLHGEGREIGGVSFFGLGGGVPVTPFPWGFDLTEEQAEHKLAACPDGAVLVVHSPPKGYADEAFGRHLGSPPCDRVQAATARDLRPHPPVLGSGGADRADPARQRRAGRDDPRAVIGRFGTAASTGTPAAARRPARALRAAGSIGSAETVAFR